MKNSVQFQNILRAIGFEVKLKPFITKDPTGPQKGDTGMSVLRSMEIEHGKEQRCARIGFWPMATRTY